MKLSLTFYFLFINMWIIAQNKDLSREAADNIFKLIKEKEYELIHDSFIEEVRKDISIDDLKIQVDIAFSFFSKFQSPKYEQVQIIIANVETPKNIDFTTGNVQLKYYKYPFYVDGKETDKAILVGFIEEISTSQLVLIQVQN